MMFFSATYEAQVMEFAEIIVPNPIIIQLRREQESLDNIKQYFVKCRNQDEKYQAIQNIYGVITIGQAIIFCHVSIFVLVLCLNHINNFPFILINRLEKPLVGYRAVYHKMVTPLRFFLVI